MNKRMFRINDDIHLIPNEHDSTLIWLHGLGDTADGWRDLFQSDLLPSLQTTKIVLMTAPTQPVTINDNMQMPSWYDILSLEVQSDENVKPYNQQQVQESEQNIKYIMDQEIQQIDHNRLVIGGFSQGAAMSLLTGLQYNTRIAGIASFSGYMFPHLVESHTNRDTPVMIYHGLQDEVVQWKHAQQSYQNIKYSSRINLNTNQYMGHTIDIKGVELLNQFIKKVFKIIK